jgi:hypothetical protein
MTPGVKKQSQNLAASALQCVVTKRAIPHIELNKFYVSIVPVSPYIAVNR